MPNLGRCLQIGIPCKALSLAAIAFAFFYCVLTSTPAHAQTFSVLHSFTGAEGTNPRYGLARDSAGNLYGATQYGGIIQNSNCDEEEGGGTVYKVAPSGKTTALYAFNERVNGCFPSSGLVIDRAGNLYGTTTETVYTVNPAGELSTIYSAATPSQGTDPNGTLALDSQGNLYGTTANGGNSACQYGVGCGTVFELSASGAESVLLDLPGGAAGYFPQTGVVRDAEGNLYGTATDGGLFGPCNLGCGIVFKLSPEGVETVLHFFAGGTDGQWPRSGLVIDKEGNLYGVTSFGGNLDCGTQFGCGAVYKVSPSGEKSVVYTFQGGRDGASPSGSLTMDSAGNLYGTTSSGGDAHNDGTVFKLTPSGIETILHRFNNTDGSNPNAGVILDSQGNLYGTTTYGGAFGEGVVFQITR